MSHELTGAPVEGSPAKKRIGFVLLDSFSMLSYVSAIEPLRVANRLGDGTLYSWHTFSLDGSPVCASNGCHQHVEAEIGGNPGCSHLFVCGPFFPTGFRHNRLHAWLQRQANHRVVIGGLETGAFVLAAAGLLDGYRCTVHWENLSEFQREYPAIEVSSELFEIDRNRMTCSGGSAPLDMMLSLIRMEHGAKLASAASELLIHPQIRQAGDPQRMDLRSRIGVSQPRLLACIALMESHIENPLEPLELARRVGVSKRQLERLFRRYLDTTPARYYLNLRLDEARRQLEQTSRAIIEVALSCGFSSAGHFSHCFRNRFDHTPRQVKTGEF